LNCTGKALSIRRAPDRCVPQVLRADAQGLRALEAPRQVRLTEEVTSLLERLNVGGSHSPVVPSEYLEVLSTKK